jgi:uncharacterized protein YggE
MELADMDPEIVVRGTGEARALPDLASLRVEVTADGKSQDEAHSARTDVAGKVDHVLKLHANAIARTTTASLWVQPRTRWHRGEAVVTGWRATRTTFVDVVVLDALGAVMSEVVTAGASVTGPNWSMAPGNIAFDVARRAAAEDARRRAIAYSETLGLELGDVTWVAEPGLRAPAAKPLPDPVVAAPAAAAASAPDREPVEDLTPTEIRIEVAVDVGFAIA